MGFFSKLFGKKTEIHDETEKTEKAQIEIPKANVIQDVGIGEYNKNKKINEKKQDQEEVNGSAKIEAENNYEECESAGEMSHLDFGKPVGELGCFLNYRKYMVDGKEKESGKKRRKFRTGVSEQQAIKKVLEEGLLPPFEVVPEEYELPTDRQLNYLQNLGAIIPEGITANDAACMISRIIDYNNEEGPNESLVSLANGLKTEFSAFVGEKQLFNCIIQQADSRTRAALYIYGVRQDMRGDIFENMLEDVEVEKFYSFADIVISDPKLLKSLNCREAEDYKKPHKGTMIYRAAAEYL